MSKKQILIIGDILAIAFVTVIGFATHGETGLSFLPRMFATFIPLTIAWFLLVPWFDLFEQEVTSDPKQLWRPVFAMVFAGSFAVILRGLFLNAPIIPIFAIVLSATSAFGMVIWRTLFFFLNRNAR